MSPMKDASMACLSVGVPVEPSEKSDNAAICKQSCQYTTTTTRGLRHGPVGTVLHIAPVEPCAATATGSTKPRTTFETFILSFRW